MAKSKASRKPLGVPEPRAGLPQVPAIYGLKERQRYLPWSHAEQRLKESRNYWICTARPDGRPHSIPVWGFWMDGALYFGSARSSRKARNIAHKAAVSIHLESGDDVVIVEGEATEFNDKATLKKLDGECREKYKMPLMIVSESVLYRVRPRTALAWTEKDFLKTATRWEFPEEKS